MKRKFVFLCKFIETQLKIISLLYYVAHRKLHHEYGQ